VPCSYDDVGTLTDDVARACCIRSHSSCALPTQLDGVIGGLSCKDWSKVNTRPAKQNSAALYASGSSPGQSSDCMHGFLNLLDATVPDWFIVENVDDLAESDQHRPAMDLFLHDLGQRGYETKIYVVDVASYALPQHRVRMYILGVLRPARRLRIADYTSFFDKVGKVLDILKMHPPSLNETMFDETDRRVQAVLENKLKTIPSEGLTSKVMDSHRAAWKKVGMRFTTGSKLVREADGKSPWWGTLCLRKRACLEYHQHIRASRLKINDNDQARKRSARFAVADLSMSIEKTSTGLCTQEGKLVSCTLLPRSDVYVSIQTGDAIYADRDIHRPLIGEEFLMLNGFPTRDARYSTLVDNHSNTFLAELGGNAFASTVIIALVTALLFSAEVKASGDDDGVIVTKNDAAEAIHLLKRARLV
jgi:site-specific DNA-cytosine methylase